MKYILMLTTLFCSLYGARSTGPNFMVIGVAKGGTTSLYDYLNSHPCINMPKTKEIHFFDDNYTKDLKNYLKNFPSKTNGNFPFSGDITPRYLVTSYVPKRVFSHFPDMKLIVLLRNPVDRSFSHYKQHLYPESFKTFEECLIAEFNLLSKKRADLPLLQRGFYAMHLKQWLKFFPKEQLLILIAEDFYKKTQETMDKIYTFLDLPPYKHTSFPISNEGVYKGIPLQKETREMLKDFYIPHNLELQELFNELGLGMTLKWD